MDHALNIWGRITDEIKAQVNEASLNLFMNSIQPRGIEGETLFLEAINEICKDWNERRYRGLIQKILQESTPPLHCVFVTRLSKNKFEKPQQLGLPTISDSEEKKVLPVPEKPRPTSKGELMFNGKYTFDTFVVGKSNQFAHAICQAVAKNLGTMYNPVFIYGGVGLGKTHLMQAIGQEILCENPKLKVAYLSSEAFTNDFIESITIKRMSEFRAKYRKKDLLLIDDVQFFAGKEAVVDEFFHTFNELFQNKKQIVLTSDSPPQKINKLEERLVSRFEMGMVADIQPPDLEMRVAILKKIASQCIARVSDEVLMYLAENVTDNIRVLEGAFNRVVAYAGVVQKTVDRDLVDHILKDFLRENSTGKLTISWVQKRVSQYYDIPEGEMSGKRRSQVIVLPRQVAMKLIQMLTDSSLSQIGAAFGGRDHTTVMHSCEKITNLLKNDQDFRQEFERITRYVDPRSRR